MTHTPIIAITENTNTLINKSFDFRKEKQPMKHTPGPWKMQADPEMAGKHILHNSRFITTGDCDLTQDGRFHDGEIICKMTDCSNQESNARLIAAAPELLLALKELIRLNEPGILEGLEEAKAAISKAEGR